MPLLWLVYIYSMRFIVVMKQLLKPMFWIQSVLLGALKFLFTPILWKQITLFETIRLFQRNWGSRFSASWLIRNLELIDYRIVESKLEIAEYIFALRRDRSSLFLVYKPLTSDIL